jgi:hypothetical protein
MVPTAGLLALLGLPVPGSPDSDHGDPSPGLAGATPAMPK